MSALTSAYARLHRALDCERYGPGRTQAFIFVAESLRECGLTGMADRAAEAAHSLTDADMIAMLGELEQRIALVNR